jgi:hypothetical protein
LAQSPTLAKIVDLGFGEPVLLAFQPAAGAGAYDGKGSGFWACVMRNDAATNPRSLEPVRPAGESATLGNCVHALRLDGELLLPSSSFFPFNF